MKLHFTFQKCVFIFRVQLHSAESQENPLNFRATGQEKHSLGLKDSLDYAIPITESICLQSFCFCFNWNREIKINKIKIENNFLSSFTSPL